MAIIYRDAKGRFTTKDKAVSSFTTTLPRNTRGRFIRTIHGKERFEEKPVGPMNDAWRVLFRIRETRRYELHDIVFNPDSTEETIRADLDAKYESGGDFAVKMSFLSKTPSKVGTKIFLASIQAGGNYQ